jgi:citrate lyase subunit beta/citryl-CoA lyase
MKMRSFLFVPGDSDRKFDKASSAAGRDAPDVIICDLEDAVAPAQKAEARGRVAGWLDQAANVASSIFVRVNPFDTDLTSDDVAAIVKPGLAGIVLPKANSGEDVAALSKMIGEQEAAHGMKADSVKLLVLCTETPAALFNLGSFAPADPRLIGLTWGAEDLGAALGVTANKDEDGQWTFPFAAARAQCLFAAANAQVVAIETLYTDFRDPEGLAEDCRKARRDGFSGRLAIHPAQVSVINAAFTPSDEELAHARKIVEAFAANPDAGTLGIDGKMVDIPHLVMAKKLLAAAS